MLRCGTWNSYMPSMLCAESAHGDQEKECRITTDSHSHRASTLMAHSVCVCFCIGFWSWRNGYIRIKCDIQAVPVGLLYVVVLFFVGGAAAAAAVLSPTTSARKVFCSIFYLLFFLSFDFVRHLNGSPKWSAHRFFLSIVWQIPSSFVVTVCVRVYWHKTVIMPGAHHLVGNMFLCCPVS